MLNAFKTLNINHAVFGLFSSRFVIYFGTQQKVLGLNLSIVVRLFNANPYHTENLKKNKIDNVD